MSRSSSPAHLDSVAHLKAMPALVLLHAFPLDRSMWDREVRALSDAASPIIAPSFPGFGKSELPPDEPSLDDYADAVIAVLDAARVERAAFAGLAMGGRPDSIADLATIDVPTAVIVGEADAITPLANAKTMHERIRHSSLTVIPDAGHLANIEAPEAFDKALRAWLNRPG